MLKIDKKTGEIVVTAHSKFMHPTVGRDPGSMIIDRKDFSWSDEIRDFIVVDAGKEDRQAYIDSFKDESGVYNVLKRYAVTGDASLLNQREGFYGDISELPVNDLNAPSRVEAAKKAAQALSESLGREIKDEDLAKMSLEELSTLITEVSAAKKAQLEADAAKAKEGDK